jgi:adenylate kinase family enzyme
MLEEIKSKQKGAIFESILNGNIDNKTDARDEETITEVDDKMVKNSKANPEVIFDKAPMPIEFADVTSAEDDDQLTALKTSPGSKYPKSEPTDAATLNLSSQTQNAETVFKKEENFSEDIQLFASYAARRLKTQHSTHVLPANLLKN